ncbi:hypothetical protein [Niallia taxi]|uniref:Uncharacterized protein n=1 Tax=Niallia taxi TaxID=2499688 RepID=A0A437K4B7_9BACI|nr:hypothetical protein [Niallia taxi]RVT57402.1 hypothetical protein EM808_24565 [Niallia taxi]
MTEQEKLDQLLEGLSDKYQKLNAKQQQFAVKEIERVRSQMNDILADYADSEGIIKRTRLNALLRELESIEKAVRTNSMDALESIIKESSEALTVGIGTSIAAAGIAFDKVNANVFRYVVNRFGEDGLVLSDRVWQLAGDQREQISKVLRSGIIRGESVNTLIAAVRQVFANETWKIKRLVVTEGNTAYRVASAYSAQQSEVVKAMQVHRGKADRPDHRCTQLELADSYGMGRGIYPATASEIYMMHPNCTGYLTYVLDERWL